MKIFLSWSGNKSQRVANAFAEWIRHVIQAVEPWVSTEIQKGARWQKEVADRLEDAKIGIIFLTPENLSAPWILFEAGALSKVQNTHVCTYLLHVLPTDVAFPLGQFQHTSAEKADTLKLLKSINSSVKACGENALLDSNLEKVFEVWWPSLESTLNEIAAVSPPDPRPLRSTTEMFVEILETLRSPERNQLPEEQMSQHQALVSEMEQLRQLVQSLGGSVQLLTNSVVKTKTEPNKLSSTQMLIPALAQAKKLEATKNAATFAMEPGAFDSFRKATRSATAFTEEIGIVDAFRRAVEDSTAFKLEPSVIDEFRKAVENASAFAKELGAHNAFRRAVEDSTAFKLEPSVIDEFRKAVENASAFTKELGAQDAFRKALGETGNISAGGPVITETPNGSADITSTLAPKTPATPKGSSEED